PERRGGDFGYPAWSSSAFHWPSFQPLAISLSPTWSTGAESSPVTCCTRCWPSASSRLTVANGTPRRFSSASAFSQAGPQGNVNSVTGKRSVACCTASDTSLVLIVLAVTRLVCRSFAPLVGARSE